MEDNTALQDLTAEASLSLADSHHIDGDYAEAIDAYAAAISLIRNESHLHIRSLSHRSAAFFQMGRFQEALDDAQEALELLSTQRPAKLRQGEGELCHKRAGLAAFRLERYTQAKDSFQQAVELASLNHRSNVIPTYQEWIQQCDEKLAPPSAAVGGVKPAAEPSVATSQPSVEEVPIVEELPPKPAMKAAPAKAPSPAPKPAPKPAPTAAASSKAQRPQMPKYQYYQSNNVMTISILEASVQPEDLLVDFQPNRLTVQLTKGGEEFTVIAGTLYADIVVERSKVVYKDEKVLIKLRKVESNEWHELFGKPDQSIPPKPAPKAPAKEAPKDTAIPRPYASHRDWDAIEKDVIQEEKNEKPQGDEAMNQLFKQIYSNADEDTQRAMVKSFQTSGGTVLSTNWDEVKKKDYEKERTAPKGQEWKSWDGDKLPMKDDD